jgi:hypothetical protein
MLLTGAAGPALAGTNVDIGVGIGGGYPSPGPRYVSSRISCREGVSIVRSAGFRHVRAVNCHGKNFAYRGVRRDALFEIKVRSRTGQIADVIRLRRGGWGGGYGDGYDDGGYGGGGGYDDDYDDEY